MEGVEGGEGVGRVFPPHFCRPHPSGSDLAHNLASYYYTNDPNNS